MTGDNAGMLARLMSQAEGQGADLVTLRALIEEASEKGAERALGALGLRDARRGGTWTSCASCCRRGGTRRNRRCGR
jgi:hypothetical protein